MTKPRRGRPPQSIDGAARKQRKVWFSDREWAWILARAEQEGVSMSEWIRNRTLRGSRKVLAGAGQTK